GGITTGGPAPGNHHDGSANPTTTATAGNNGTRRHGRPARPTRRDRPQGRTPEATVPGGRGEDARSPRADRTTFMDPVKLQQALDEVFDQALLHHGFVDYMRDYELVIHVTADPRTGVAPSRLRCLFRYCVQANCATTVPAGVWKDSLDDRLTNYETG